jgi:prepilin-type processing-associated H-X9-DG protein
MHNIGNAVFAYAADNGGWLPMAKIDPGWYLARTGSDGPLGIDRWMWDMPAATRDMLVKYGVIHQAFYCPSNAETQNDTGTGSLGAGTSEWDYNAFYNYPTITNQAISGNAPVDSAGFGVMGYVFLITRLDPGSGVTKSQGNGGLSWGDSRSFGNLNLHWDLQSKLRPQTTPNPNPLMHNASHPPIAAQTELAVEEMVTSTINNAATNQANLNWGTIFGGWPKPEPSAHLYGPKPAGMNVLFMDGHVDWRDISQCYPRAYPNSGPWFWW